jgi:hypothetical protein
VNRREAVPAAAAVLAPAAALLVRALMAPHRSYPLAVNLLVLGVVAVFAYGAAADYEDRRGPRRALRLEREAAERRRAALATAADCVITGRSDAADGTRPHPSDSPSVTPAAVARYAATMGVPAVTLEEATTALRGRLVHRGYAPARSPEAEEL